MLRFFTLKIAFSVFILTLTINGAFAQTIVGSALHFDASNDFVHIPHRPKMNFTEFTIEMWFNYNGSSPFGIGFLTSKGTEQLEIHTIDDQIRFIPTPGVYIDCAKGAFSPNQWNHLACVYKPDASIAKIFINGVDMPTTLSGSNPVTTPVSNNSSALRIGYRLDNSFAFGGAVDEFRLWDRALTQAEIQSRMMCEIQQFSQGLIVNYNFNQGTAGGTNFGLTTVLDRTANGINGTLTNFVLAGTSSNWIAPGGIANGATCGITGSNASCGAVVLTATGGNSYAWSAGLTPNAAINTFTTPGFYTVTITYPDFSTQAFTERVFTLTAPSAPVVSGTLSFCGSTMVSTLLGGVDFWYSTSVGGTSLSPTMLITNSGILFGTVSNGACESARTPVSIEIKTLPSQNLFPNDSAIFCGPKRFSEITAPGVTLSFYNFLSETTPIGGEFFASNFNYWFTQTAPNGCTTAKRQVRLELGEEPDLDLEMNPFITINAGETIEFKTLAYNAGSNPTYRWFINHTLLGVSGNAFQSATLQNGDTVKVEVLPNNACQTTNIVKGYRVIDNIRTPQPRNHFYQFMDVLAVSRAITTGDLGSAEDVLFGPDNTLLIADFNRGNISVRSFNGTNLTFLQELGSFGTGASQFMTPVALKIFDNKVFVVDYNLHRLSVWSITGPNTYTHVGNIGNFGTGPALFNNPSDIVFTNDNTMLVSDFSNNRIALYTITGTNNINYLTNITGIERPISMELLPDNRLVVTQFMSHSLSLWSFSGASFTRLTTVGGLGNTLDKFNRPFKVRHRNGKVYVGDNSNNRISVWSYTGNNLIPFTTFGSEYYTKFAKGAVEDANGNIFAFAEWDNTLTQWTACSQPTAIVRQPQTFTTCSMFDEVVLSVYVSGTGSVRYVWSNGQLTPAITVSGDGFFNVEVVGCGTVYSNAGRVKPALPTVIVTQPANTEICENTLSNIVVSATGTNLSYLWSNGNHSPALITSVAGSYTVTITGQCDFEVSNTIAITTLPSTVLVTSPQSQTVCGASMVQLNASATGVNVTYLWNTDSSMPSITAATAGFYSVTATGTCGKAIAENIQVVQLAETTILGESVLSATVTGTETATLSVVAQGQNLSYVWNTGSTQPFITDAGVGKYSVTVSGTCGSVVAEAEVFETISTAVNNHSSPAYLMVYPNPTNGKIFIEVDKSGLLGYPLSIYNAAGQMVYNQMLTTETAALNLTLGPGVYVVKYLQNHVRLMVE